MTLAPLSWQELLQLLPHPLTGHVAVAVSGGADSMALALITQDLCHQTGARFTALTVDHALRPESSSEAKEVHQWFTNQKLNHHILTWQHEVITTGLQKKARKARYDLLNQWCLDNNVSTLLTAHHALDQWETIMMRLAKGSGLTGLCGIRPVVKTDFGVLIRPLLTIGPKRLLETVHHYDAPFWQDPSNENTIFTRVRFRVMYETLKMEGLDVDAIYKTSQRLQQADDCLNEITKKAYDTCIKDGNLLLPLFCQQPLEIAHRLLKEWLQTTCKSPYPLSFQSLNRLHKKLMSPAFKGATAGGCILKKGQGKKVHIKKESR